MTEPKSILEVQGIRAGYAGRTILDEVTLAIRHGESVALIGPNGCGKSTLFRVMAGVLRAEAGEVVLEGRDLTRISTDERIRAGVGYPKQTKNIFAGLTVEENLALAGESGNGGGGELGSRMRAFPALSECLDKRAGLLSGGQRQALAVAMVLMRPPKVLLLDEPVAGLSPVAGKSLLDALESLRREEGFATVIVEHRLRQVQPHVNRVLVMREGRIVDDTANTERMLDAAWLAGHYRRQGGMSATRRPAEILIVGDTPAFGKTVAAILGGDTKPARMRHTTYEKRRRSSPGGPAERIRH